MAMVALPTINQGALPAGSPGDSRDDLQLGAPVVVSDSGPGPTRKWTLADKPDGSLAVLSAASGASTQFTPDVEGTYRVKLEVNDGPDAEHIAYVGAGVQIPLPSWVTPATFVRIPAFGEKLEFNARPSPGAGANTRGWALEVNQFLRVLALNAFGIQVSDGGVPVPGEFRTVNFLNATVTNAGGGVIEVEPLPDTGSSEAGYPVGVADINDSQLAWDDATKTLTHSVLAPAASFRVYEVGGGVRLAYDFAVAQSVAIAVPAYGLWWFYYEGGVFKTAQTLPDGWRSTIIAAVYLNAAHNAIAVLDERHGINMPWATHEYLHTTIGTRFDNGFGLSRVAAGTGAADGDAEVIITGGTIWDEDIRVQITRSAAPSARFEQEIGETAVASGQIPLYHRTGALGTWEKLTATNAPLHQLGAGLRPVYNRWTGAVWDLFAISANARYTICYVCATNNLGNVDGAGYLCEPVFAILGQGDYTLEDAQNASFADLQLGGAGGFFAAELKPLYKLIYRVSTGFANTYKAYLYEFTDLRNVAPLPGTSFVATDHQSLSGRTTLGAHPATAIAVDASGFVGNLLTTDDDVQKVAAAVDGIVGLIQQRQLIATHADLTAAGPTETLNIGAVLPANATILGTTMHGFTPFTGGVIGDFNVDIGTAADEDALVVAADLFTAALDGAPATIAAGVNPSKTFVAAGAQLTAKFNCASDDVGDATAGAITINVVFAVLPPFVPGP